MKFTSNKSAVASLLANVSRAVNQRPALAVLTGIKITVEDGIMTAVGSDLDLTITDSVSVTASKNGGCVVPSKLITDVTRSLDDTEVTFELVDSTLTIKSEESVFNLRTVELDEFPKLEDIDGEVVHADAKGLADAIEKVVVAASDDDTKPVLTGVLIEAHEDELRIVATDSYRLAMATLRGYSFVKEGQHVLVPAPALSALNRKLGETENLDVIIADKSVGFQIGTWRMTTRLIEGAYPNYKGLIPEESGNKLIVNRERLVSALRRVRLLAGESNNVKLQITSKHLSLSSEAADLGDAADKLECEFTGGELTIAFNPEYLAIALKSITEENAVFEFESAMKPATLVSDGYTHLLMPVRS